MLHEETRDLEKIKVDISARLRSACAHFPPGEFDELVHQIARIELKYSRYAEPPALGNMP